jgi:hypothetical protein
MEDPALRAEYEAALAAEGLTTRMDPRLYAGPPTADMDIPAGM